MSFTFSPDTPRLIVPAAVVGPDLSHEFRQTLDTGSESTVIHARYLRWLGVDVSRPLGWTRLRTATGTARAPLVRVPAVSALGRVRKDLLVAAHDYPIGVQADGVLGLDFFRDLVLRIDFARGRVALDPPRQWWQVWRAA